MVGVSCVNIPGFAKHLDCRGDLLSLLRLLFSRFLIFFFFHAFLYLNLYYEVQFTDQKLQHQMLKISFIFLIVFFVSCNDRHKLTFLHFNDVYDLLALETQPKAGAAYFKAMLDRYREDQTLTFFSGDTFAPSLLSRQYDGQNMVLPLNQFKIDLATFGNHQFDYKLQRVVELIGKTNFPWLNTNMINSKTNRRLAQGLEYYIIHRGGYKIGLFSLVEQELIQLFIPQYFDFCKILNETEIALKMVQKLREQEKCDLVFALTHMTIASDRELSRNVKGIDINFGGHDHSIIHEIVNGSLILKSGADFKHFSKVQFLLKFDGQKNQLQELKLKRQFQQRKSKSYEQIFYYESERFEAIVTFVEINHSKAEIIPDPVLLEYTSKLQSEFKQKLQKVALYTKYPIDLRVHTIRKNQSPYLNFIAQLYKHASKADCTIINSGAFREDRLIEAGPITLATFMNFIKDDITVKVLNGEDLYLALENSVSLYPGIAGRYGQLANIEFVWYAENPPMSRIEYDTIRINGQPINKSQLYKVAFRDYCAKGSDGYTSVKAAPYAEDTHPIPMVQVMIQLLSGSAHLLREFRWRDKIAEVQRGGEKYLELRIEQNLNMDKIKMRSSLKQEEL